MVMSLEKFNHLLSNVICHVCRRVLPFKRTLLVKGSLAIHSDQFNTLTLAFDELFDQQAVSSDEQYAVQLDKIVHAFQEMYRSGISYRTHNTLARELPVHQTSKRVRANAVRKWRQCVLDDVDTSAHNGLSADGFTNSLDKNSGHTGGSPKKSTSKSYVCQLCGKTFTFATNLTRHQRNFHQRPPLRLSRTSTSHEKLPGSLSPPRLGRTSASREKLPDSLSPVRLSHTSTSHEKLPDSLSPLRLSCTSASHEKLPDSLSPVHLSRTSTSHEKLPGSLSPVRLSRTSTSHEKLHGSLSPVRLSRTSTSHEKLPGSLSAKEKSTCVRVIRNRNDRSTPSKSSAARIQQKCSASQECPQEESIMEYNREEQISDTSAGCMSMDDDNECNEMDISSVGEQNKSAGLRMRHNKARKPTNSTSYEAQRLVKKLGGIMRKRQRHYQSGHRDKIMRAAYHENSTVSNTTLATISADLPVVCDKETSRNESASDMASHYVPASENRDSYQFRCTICKRAFRFYHNLGRHVKKTHAVSILELNMTTDHLQMTADRQTGKQHVCTLCGNVFSFASNLSRHKRLLHNGNSHVNTVAKKNTNRRPDRCYSCDLCPLTFTFAGNLTRHLRQMHGVSRLETNRSPAVVQIT